VIKKGEITSQYLEQRIRSSLPGRKSLAGINSIYIDYHSDPSGELGVVTDCGCFLVLKNKSSSLSREPLFVPDVSLLGECQFLTSKKLESISDLADQKVQVLYSLGYDNLTLTEDSLLWIGDNRIDGVLSNNQMAEIV
jgi:hypothetical protein